MLKTNNVHRQTFAHGETKRFFYIYFEEYIVLKIYTFSYIYSPSLTLQKRSFWSRFLSIGAKEMRMIFDVMDYDLSKEAAGRLNRRCP